MKPRATSPATLVALAILTSVLVTAGGRPAGAATTTFDPPAPVVLPGVGDARDLAVAGSYLYVSVEAGLSSAEPDAVAQISFDGTIHNLLGPIDGAWGVVVRQGVLYVAAASGNTIDRYDLSTDPPTLLGKTDVSPFTTPRHIAVTNGRIWFDTNCLNNARIVSIAPDGTDLQKELPYKDEDDLAWRNCANVQASPLTKHLFVNDDATYPSHLAVYDVSGSPYTRLTDADAGQWMNGDYVPGAIEPLAGGSTVAMSAFPSPSQGLDIRTIADLTVSHHYDADWAAVNSLDHTDAEGGMFAAGFYNSDASTQGLGILPDAATAPTVQYQIPDMLNDGVAFSPDGSKVFVVSTTSYQTRLSIIDPLTIPTTLSLGATPSSLNVGDEVSLDGTLTAADDQVDGREIEITRDDGTGPVDIGPATTDASGDFHLTDDPPVGELTYTATFQATGEYQESSAEDTVRVSALASHVSIRVSDPTITYGQSVKVTAHLGSGTTNRELSIFTKRYGGNLKLLKHGTVDKKGNLQASFTPKENTTFVVKFAGDDEYKGSSDTVRTNVHVILKAKMVQFDHRSGKYAVYRQGTYPTCIVGVTPNHRGFGVRFQLQVYYKGKWRAVGHTTVKLNRHSLAGVRVNLKAGYNARIKATLPSHADHLGDSSPWLYFRVA